MLCLPRSCAKRIEAGSIAIILPPQVFEVNYETRDSQSDPPLNGLALYGNTGSYPDR
jgi:hypothetical protein